MAPPDFTVARKRLLERLAVKALSTVKPQIPSEALRNGLVIVPEAAGRIDLHIPHYWAVYIHDGRPGFGPRRSSWLVWFANPRDDPRLQPNYPVRLSDVRRLTKQQFKDGMAENRRRAANGLPPFMLVRKFQPKPLAGSFFFTLGMQRFETVTAPPIVLDEFVRYICSVAKGVTEKPKPLVLKIKT